jgi:UDP-glucuronate decarboxylase
MSGQYKNIEYLDEFENFEFQLADIRSPLHWLNNYFDEIYNLACPASPVFYQSMPLMTIETNTL